MHTMIDTFEVRIERLVYGGEAMGRLPDGRAVFLHFAIPGELVRLRVVEEKPRYARAELVDVLEASARRVRPRCIHFTTCGGCHYQHMDYAAQVEAKLAILEEQLERIGGLKGTPIEALTSPEPWYYRNHIQFHLTKEGKLGFQKAHSNQTFAIQECHLPEPGINRIWPQVDIEPIPGLVRLSLRVGKDEDLMLILESTQPQPLDFSIEDLPISVIQMGPGGNVVLAGSDQIQIQVLGRDFKVSAPSFFQVNTLQADAMVSYIMEALILDQTMTVLDIYAGVGLFSAFLAPIVKNLAAIELSSQACEDFTANQDEFDHVSLYEASAARVLNDVSFDPDVIIMDPPREGLDAKTMRGVLNQGASQLVYVSCDPATLARDARRLVEGGYALGKLAMVDMFPQTYHIETISYWLK